MAVSDAFEPGMDEQPGTITERGCSP